MKLTINGDEKEFSVTHTVTTLLEELQIRPGRVVVELNRKIVSRECYGTTALSDGDNVEIVHFVGGG